METFIKKEITIISPVFNDWDSYNILINEIKKEKSLKEISIKFLVINDCSDNPAPLNELKLHKCPITILNLNKNYGHQTAIVIGCVYTKLNLKQDTVVIMDSDGEDQPKDIINLINNLEHYDVCLAKRTKRNEPITFKFCYSIYKFLFYILTGKVISFGNFSALNKKSLNKIILESDSMINFASVLLKLNLSYHLVNTVKGKRYMGKSKMNFNTLILHGLGAIAVHIENVAVRFLLTCTFIAFLAVTGFFIILFVKLFTSYAIPGWATSLSTNLFIIITQAVIICLFLTFIVIIRKSQSKISPVEDYLKFIEKCQTI